MALVETSLPMNYEMALVETSLLMKCEMALVVTSLPMEIEWTWWKHLSLKLEWTWWKHLSLRSASLGLFAQSLVFLGAIFSPNANLLYTMCKLYKTFEFFTVIGGLG